MHSSWRRYFMRPFVWITYGKIILRIGIHCSTEEVVRNSNSSENNTKAEKI
jgi:hypothetical protein